ncbi:MAG: carboxypeptidase-like regulatory domain-containing protein, partial [Nonlabens sp.]
MKNLSLFLPLTLLFIIATNAQKVSGLVVDTKSEPIAYATIQVADYGTITNAEGEFELRVGNLPDDTNASISFIGYKTLELTVVKLKEDDRFVLQKDIMSLDEVFVTNKRYTPEELIEKVLERVDSN